MNEVSNCFDSFGVGHRAGHHSRAASALWLLQVSDSTYHETMTPKAPTPWKNVFKINRIQYITVPWVCCSICWRQLSIKELEGTNTKNSPPECWDARNRQKPELKRETRGYAVRLNAEAATAMDKCSCLKNIWKRMIMHVSLALQQIGLDFQCFPCLVPPSTSGAMQAEDSQDFLTAQTMLSCWWPRVSCQHPGMRHPKIQTLQGQPETHRNFQHEAENPQNQRRHHSL